MSHHNGKTKEKAPHSADEKLTRKDYESELGKLHVELVKLQEWTKYQGMKVCVVFEGRDGAGKGGTIKALTERVSPRVFRVAAAARSHGTGEKPDVPATVHMSLSGRRRDRHFRPQLVQPRRRRARDGVLHREQTKRFLAATPLVERAMVDSGIILLKYWLEVSPQEQSRRLEGRINDGRKTWKLSPMDIKSYNKWDDYTEARDEMFAATDTPWAPWYVVRSDDKKRARLNIISHLLSRFLTRTLRAKG